MINERGHTPLLLLMEETFVGQNVAIYIQVGYEAKRHIHPLMKCLFWAKSDRNYSNISFDAPIQLAYFSILWESPGLMGPHTSYCQYFRVNFPLTSWLTLPFWNLSWPTWTIGNEQNCDSLLTPCSGKYFPVGLVLGPQFSGKLVFLSILYQYGSTLIMVVIYFLIYFLSATA